MHEPINNLTRQIRINLREGFTASEAIRKDNVQKALEILAGRIEFEGSENWLGNMSKDELIEGYQKAQKEI